MAWTRSIDLYCERVSASWWSEPFNVVSNGAFFVAAWSLRARLHRQGVAWQDGRDLHVLWMLVAAIGVGSTLFHVSGQRWGAVIDVLFIAVYLHAYVAITVARRWRVPWRYAWLGIPGFQAFAQGIDALVGLADADALTRGSAGYVPALVALALLAVASWWRGGPQDRLHARWLFAAALAFCASLIVRTVDLPLCARWPLGTHFAWHLINAAVLWASARALIDTSSARRVVSDRP